MEWYLNLPHIVVQHPLKFQGCVSISHRIWISIKTFPYQFFLSRSPITWVREWLANTWVWRGEALVTASRAVSLVDMDERLLLPRRLIWSTSVRALLWQIIILEEAKILRTGLINKLLVKKSKVFQWHLSTDSKWNLRTR